MRHSNRRSWKQRLPNMGSESVYLFFEFTIRNANTSCLLKTWSNCEVEFPSSSSFNFSIEPVAPFKARQHAHQIKANADARALLEFKIVEDVRNALVPYLSYIEERDGGQLICKRDAIFQISIEYFVTAIKIARAGIRIYGKDFKVLITTNCVDSAESIALIVQESPIGTFAIEI